MSTRHRAYYPIDDAPLRAGDGFWIGVDESLAPDLLPAGMVASATNKRFVKGQAHDRLGNMILPLGPSNGAFDVSAGAVRGAGLYSEPGGEEWWLVAAAGKVYRCRPNNQAVEIALNGVALTDEVAFTQGNEQLLLGRGFDAAPLRLKTFDAGFETITQETSGAGNGTGTLPLPNFRYAAYLQNRIIAVGAQDIGYVSDIRNLTRYSILNAFRVNTGDADELVRIVPFGEQAVVAFKTQSIYPVTGLSADGSGDWSNAVLGDITRTHGLAAPRAVAQVGNDLWYLGTGGRLTSVRLNEQNKLQLRDVPLTDRMSETMARVNSAYLDKAILLYLNNKTDSKLFLFLPLDDARTLGGNVAAGTYSGLGQFDPVYGTTYYTLTISGLTAGVKYRYEPGTREVSLVNGASTHYGATDFTAAGTTVELHGTAGAATATIKPVLYEGVLNAVLVYDFNAPTLPGQDVPGQWMGVDEQDGLAIHSAWIGHYHDQPRVISLGHDGVIRLHEEGFEDQTLAAVATPYVDLLVNTPAAAGQTLRVNGGTILTVAGSNSITDPPTTGEWGAGAPPNYVTIAATNLWHTVISFNPAATYQWTCPNTTPSQIDRGVRFTSTNGVVPEIKINGTPATGYAGASNWAYIDSHSGTEIACVPITSSMTTRGYTCDQDGRKQFLQAKLDLSLWSPSLTVTAIVDGVNETSALLSALTKDRTAFTTWQAAAYSTANPNDDATDPYREDYSLPLPALGTDLGDNGVYTDELQDHEEPVRIAERGRYVQLKLANTQGRATVRALTIEALAIDRALVART